MTDKFGFYKFKYNQLRPILIYLSITAFLLSIHFWAVSAEIKVDPKVDPKKAKGDKPSSFYALNATSIDGAPVALSSYANKVLLVVNTASKCGFTTQYGGLEKMYREFKDRGLVVLGFPSNDFGGQEPAPEKEVKKFCESEFGVSFPLFAKVKVLGPGKSPIYQFLIADSIRAGLATGEVSWNFEKFLISRKGAVIGRFKSQVEPESEELRRAIQKALEQP